MEGRGEAKIRKEKVTQYTKYQGNTQVEGRWNLFQESMFVRYTYFTGRKQGDYNILKEKDHRSLRVACAHAALDGSHQSIHVEWEILISQGKDPNPLKTQAGTCVQPEMFPGACGMHIVFSKIYLP